VPPVDKWVQSPVGLDKVGNPKDSAVVSGQQIVEEIEGMNVYQINALDFLPQGAG
jgi:hypothetical protein